MLHTKSPAVVAATVVFLVSLSAFYIATPLGGDQQVSFGAAHQVEYHGDFPGSVVRAWNLRGLGCKLFYYGIHWVVTAVVGCIDKPPFERFVRAIWLAAWAATFAVAIALTKDQLKHYGLTAREAALPVALAIMCSSHWCSLQAEEMALMPLILALAFGLRREIGWQVVAGLLLSSTVTFKGTTGMLGLIGVVARHFLKPHDLRGTVRIAFIWFTGTVALVVFLVVFVPTEVRDLQDAALFQTSLEAPLVLRLRTLTDTVFRTWPHVPILLPGVLAWLVVLGLETREGQVRVSATLALLWVMGAMPILLQSKPFGYHLLTLIPAACASLLTASALLRRRKKRFVTLALNSTAAAVGVLCLSWSPVAPGQTVPSSITARMQSVRATEAGFQRITANYGLNREPTVLYLDSGFAAYYVGARSHLRHLYPLPLQRENRALRENPVYENALAEAIRFEGRYVLLDPEWFPLWREDLVTLRNKLAGEYSVVDRGPRVLVLRRVTNFSSD